MSEILNIAHEMGKDLFKVGAVDGITMRKLDALCLPQTRPLLPDDIRRIRTANHVSQAVFAAILGIGKTTVQQWEQGQKNPVAQRDVSLILSTARAWLRLANCTLYQGGGHNSPTPQSPPFKGGEVRKQADWGASY